MRPPPHSNRVRALGRLHKAFDGLKNLNLAPESISRKGNADSPPGRTMLRSSPLPFGGLYLHGVLSITLVLHSFH